MSETIFRSPLATQEIPDVADTAHVLRRATALADKPAMIDGPTGRTVTYHGSGATNDDHSSRAEPPRRGLRFPVRLATRRGLTSGP